MSEKKTATKGEVKFTKEQIVSSKKYKEQSDIVRALLDDNGTYTVKDVDGIIEKFRKGKVK